MGKSRSLILALALIASSSTAARAVADESYYVLVFASQTHPKLLSKAHTWATFVRVDSSDSPSLHVHTISWLPRTLKVRTFALRPEPGGNLELHQTLGVVLSEGQAVSMWGPYRIAPDVYARSLEVKGTLESGLTQYRAFSPANDLRLANCNQAVLFVGPEFGRRPRPLWRTGTSAGRYVSRNVEAHSPAPATDDPWLVPTLGLDRYPIRFMPPHERPTGLPTWLSY